MKEYFTIVFCDLSEEVRNELISMSGVVAFGPGHAIADKGQLMVRLDQVREANRTLTTTLFKNQRDSNAKF